MLFIIFAIAFVVVAIKVRNWCPLMGIIKIAAGVLAIVCVIVGFSIGSNNAEVTREVYTIESVDVESRELVYFVTEEEGYDFVKQSEDTSIKVLDSACNTLEIVTRDPQTTLWGLGGFEKSEYIFRIPMA